MTRSPHQSLIDQIRSYHNTPDYETTQRKRSVWVEPMFAEAKTWHNLRRFRLRKLLKVNIQALLTAAGRHVKRLLKAKLSNHTPDPTSLIAFTLHFHVSMILIAQSNMTRNHAFIPWTTSSTR